MKFKIFIELLIERRGGVTMTSRTAPGSWRWRHVRHLAGSLRSWNQSWSSESKLAYWRIKNQPRFHKKSFANTRITNNRCLHKNQNRFHKKTANQLRFHKKSFEHTRTAKQRRRFQKNRESTSLLQKTRVKLALSFQEKPPKTNPESSLTSRKDSGTVSLVKWILYTVELILISSIIPKHRYQVVDECQLIIHVVVVGASLAH